MSSKAEQVGKAAGQVIINKRSFSFFSTLTLILITLKLTGYITIGWGWIVVCFFGPLILLVTFLVVVCGGILIFFAGFALVIYILEKYEDNKRSRKIR